MAQNSKEEFEAPSYLRFSKVIIWLMYIWVLVGVIALFLRTFLLAFSANTSAGFAEFFMRVSDDYLQPFRGIFEPREIGETGFLDISAIFAIIIYLFVAWGFKTLIDYVQDKIDADINEKKQAKIRQEWSDVLQSQKQTRAKSAAAKKPVQKKTTS